MLFRALDIETVPDPRFFTRGESKWVPRPQMDGADRYASDSIAYVRESPFPPPQAHQVIAVAWCDLDLQPTENKCYALVSHHRQAGWASPSDEKTMLTSVRDAMTEQPATLVTWNGRTFDLPVLSARALHHGVPWGWYYEERNIRYRYSSDGHDDLMDFMSDFGAARPMKLGDAARLVGLPGKTDMDGSKVEEVVARGKSAENEDKISWYCLQDVIQTALFFVRTRYHLEILDAAGYTRSVDTFAADPFIHGLINVDWKKLREI